MRRFMTIAAGVSRGSFYLVALGIAIHLIVFYIPPSASTHPVDQANDIENKNLFFFPTLIVIVTSCAITGSLAGLASTIPPRPKSFVRCLALIALSAGIAQVAAMSVLPPYKGYPVLQHIVAVVGAVVGFLFATCIGFKKPATSQVLDAQQCT